MLKSSENTMHLTTTLCMIIIASQVCIVFSARILCYFPTPAVSHQAFFQPIWRALALRGHELTVITPNPLNDPTLKNLTEIDVSFCYKNFQKVPLQLIMSPDQSKVRQILNIYTHCTKTLEEQLESPGVREILQSDRKFDLVLIESVYPALDSLGWKFNAPVIGMLSLGALIQSHLSVGNPIHPLITPDVLLDKPRSMSFSERLFSTYQVSHALYSHYYNVLPMQQETARKYISSDVPDLYELSKNVSLQIISSNPIFSIVRSNVPTMIEIDFMHVKKPKPLPTDLKDILDRSKEGAVYFSLGSNIKSVHLDKRLFDDIKLALSELPFTVLWKWEDDEMTGKPENVITRKWFPQQDILAHPNVRVFVTQGGLQSTEESLSSGVPLVIIPFIADQYAIASKMEEVGCAVALMDFQKLTKSDLKRAVMEVGTNRRYKEKVLEIRDILRDQPMKSIDKAIWWIEYVIRHKGARHLRSPALDIPTYQYLLLDVIAFVLVVAVVIGYVLYKILSLLINKLISGNSNKLKIS